MKTGVSLSAFPAAAGMPALFSANLQANVPLIKDMGFDGVDLFVQDPKDEESLRAARLLKKHQLGVGVVMPAALARAGLSLADPSPDVRAETHRRLEKMIAFAADLGAMLSLGLIRGNIAAGESPEAYFGRLAASCEALLPTAQKYGVDLLIEPINRYETNALNSSLQALGFIERCALPLYLMLDTFHMNIEDASFAGSLAACAPHIRHIHFVDSNRLAPGMAHLPLEEIYSCICQAGYGGYLCIEALPVPSSAHVAQRGIDFFRQTLRIAAQCPC